MSEEDLLQRAKTTVDAPNLVPDSWSLAQQHACILAAEIANPNTKKPADWTDVRTFSLMLATHL